MAKLSFWSQEKRNVLKLLVKWRRFFFNIFVQQNFKFWDKVPMTNLVLFRFHSNSDLHTFQKIVRKKNPEKICWEEFHHENFLDKNFFLVNFFPWNVLKCMEKYFHQNRSENIYLLQKNLLLFFCVRFRFYGEKHCVREAPPPTPPTGALPLDLACFMIESPNQLVIGY